jgi:hypothetical protein
LVIEGNYQTFQQKIFFTWPCDLISRSCDPRWPPTKKNLHFLVNKVLRWEWAKVLAKNECLFGRHFGFISSSFILQEIFQVSLKLIKWFLTVIYYGFRRFSTFDSYRWCLGYGLLYIIYFCLTFSRSSVE